MNGYRQEGFAPFDRNVHRGRRLSAARAYLHPVTSRPNLEVRTRAFVTRILFEGTRAVGVEYRRGRGAPRRVRAGEVILCGGAITHPRPSSSPASGRAGGAGLDVVADVPGSASTSRTTSRSTSSTRARSRSQWHPVSSWRRPFIGAEWLFFRSGLGATNHFEAGGFVRSNDEVAYPNLMFHFLPIAIRYDGSAPASDHGYQVHIGPMYSDARGSVKAVSTDPRAPRAAVQLPLHRPGSAGMGGGDPGGPVDPLPAGVRRVRWG